MRILNTLPQTSCFGCPLEILQFFPMENTHLIFQSPSPIHFQRRAFAVSFVRSVVGWSTWISWYFFIIWATKKKTFYFPYKTGWLIGIPIIGVLESQKQRIVQSPIHPKHSSFFSLLIYSLSSTEDIWFFKIGSCYWSRSEAWRNFPWPIPVTNGIITYMNSLFLMVNVGKYYQSHRCVMG